MPARTFDFVNSWQSLTHDDAGEVLAFWSREQASVPDEAARRVQQVVIRVVGSDGELVAVSTAEPVTIPRLRQPMYYYRCFVGAAWRDGRLARPLLRHSFEVLEQWSRERDFPCIGVLLELENVGFAHALQQAHWPATGFAFIGRSMRGLDLRVRYFRGARLKTPC